MNISKPRHRWFQFSLRTLLLFVTVLCVVLAMEGRRVNRHWAAESVLNDAGISVSSRHGIFGIPLPYWIPDGFLVAKTEVSFRPDSNAKRHIGVLVDLRNLSFVRLQGSRDIGNDELAILAKVATLDYLNLDGTSITDEGVRYLAHTRRLEFLSLADTKVGDAGMSELGSLNRLEWLILSGTSVTDQGIRNLVRARSLRHLDLDRTKVTKAMWQYLHTLPNLAGVFHDEEAFEGFVDGTDEHATAGCDVQNLLTQ